MAFWVAFDHLGKLLIVNILCSTALLGMAAVVWAGVGPLIPVRGTPVLFTGWIALSAAVLFVGAAATAAMVRECIDTRDGSLSAFFRGLRRHGLPAGCIGFLYALAGLSLTYSAWYYLTGRSGMPLLLGYALAVGAAWLILGWLLLGFVVTPLLIYRPAGMGSTLRLACLLILDNPLYLGGCGLCTFLVSACTLLLPPLWICFSLAPVVVLQCSAYEMLARRYAALEKAGVVGVARRRVQVDFDDANDDYLNRGFRDLIFPWKS